LRKSGDFLLRPPLTLLPRISVAILRPMELDSYWRTRTVAEAMQDGYSHLRATCSGCGRISDIPWPLLFRPPRITTATFLGNLPLKCQRCGNTEPVIGVTRQRDAQGYMRP
jgi:hypothetical protein